MAGFNLLLLSLINYVCKIYERVPFKPNWLKSEQRFERKEKFLIYQLYACDTSTSSSEQSQLKIYLT